MDETYKAGFVSLVGKPNVGKSTLMNKLIGEKLSIISPKPQTTRQQIKGIFSDTGKQIIFLDTPGYVEPRYELHNKMLEYIKTSLADSDVIIFLTDANKYPTDYDRALLSLLTAVRVPKLGVFNKIDLVDEKALASSMENLQSYGFEEVMGISALHNTKLEKLMESIDKFLPYGPPLYNPEDLSDLPLRFFVQEIVREQIFLSYRDEIPYAAAVVVDSYKDYPNKAEIFATVYLEANSQKHIFLGTNGEKIKALRIAAEKQIHGMVGKRIKLELWVKIRANWRKNKNSLREFGYR